MSFSVVLFDDCFARERLKPLTSTRPIGNLRVGILTLDQKWSRIFRTEVSYLTRDYLREKFPLSNSLDQEFLVIHGSVLPNEDLTVELLGLDVGQKLVADDGDWIAMKFSRIEDFDEQSLQRAFRIQSSSGCKRLNCPEDIYLNNADQIEFDLAYLDTDLAPHSALKGNEFVGSAIYIANTAVLHHCFLDSSKGPIYIGAGAVLEAGTVVYGPVSIGDRCRVKSGTVLYMNVSIGEGSTICGEINNTVIWGNSAKGHLGYLGCSVIGEGCNIGAGTSNSNLRNDWKNIQLYDYSEGRMRDTGLQKCGVIMGDHVMLAINSKINTGTVIGVGCQIAISNFIPKFVLDFSWLTDGIKDLYIFDHFIGMLKRKAAGKDEAFDAKEERILSSFYKEVKQIIEINQH